MTIPERERDGRAFSAAAEDARAALRSLEAAPGSLTEPLASSLREVRTALDHLLAMDEVPASPGVVFDVSDLLNYFRHDRLPTGVQRVQGEIIRTLVEDAICDVRVCCHVSERNEWVELASAPFAALCAMSMAGGRTDDPAWRHHVQELQERVIHAAPAKFQLDDVLCTLGTAWSTPNYFLAVRELQRDQGVRFVPFFYDAIPIVTPQYCMDSLVKNFIEFFTGLIDHADYIFAISDASRRDLLQLARRAGRDLHEDRIGVQPLDADFRRPFGRPSLEARRLIEQGPYILMVATIEARKNQVGAVEAFAELVRRRGPDRAPRLILVGKVGFHAHRVFELIGEDPDLNDLVQHHATLDDTDLAALYENCLFTLYPSFYEGWGLPVTEALCYGKVPVISHVASLPEAGSDFAVYVDPASPGALTEAMEQLLDDEAERRAREDDIRARFRPTSWADLARRLIGEIDAVRSRLTPPRAPDIRVDGGAHYPITSLGVTGLWRGLQSAEVFRRGRGWWPVEPGGCWTTPSGAELELIAPDDARPLRLGFELMCPTPSEARFRMEVLGTDVRVDGPVSSASSRWVFLDVPAEAVTSPLRIRLSTTRITSSDLTFGGDHRTLGVGLKGFFVFDLQSPQWRQAFLEDVALGCLVDRWAYRDRDSAPPPLPAA